MSNGNYDEGIKLKPESESRLDCSITGGVKTCIIPLSHFNNTKSDYYYTYHLNHLYQWSIYYSATPFNVTIPDKNILIIRINFGLNEEVKNIGEKGTIDFITNYNDEENNLFDASDIEEKTIFETIAEDNNDNSYKLICRFWKPINDSLRLFCNLKDDLAFKYDSQYIEINSFPFNHKNYTIIITFENKFLINQYNYTIPFIYSDKQEINITQNTEIIEFKFKADLYKKEVIYITNKDLSYIILENCFLNEKELICKITRDKLEENLIIDNNTLYYLGEIGNLGARIYSNVFGIRINYEYPKEKKEIFIKIGKSLSNYIESSILVYEVKYIGEIDNIISN